MYCQCGCGRITGIAKRPYIAQGIKKGDHFRFIKGHGGGMARRRYDITPDLRIEEDRGFSTPCWIFRLNPRKGKYGHSTIWIGGKEYSAHRRMYEQNIGPIPAGLHLDHLCRQPSCIRPDHLEPVTPAENMRRSPAAKLTYEKVEQIRASPLSTRKAASIFGVSQSTIASVRRRNTWK